MTEKSHLPMGIKPRFLFRAARSLLNKNQTSVSRITPMTCFNGTVPVTAGDETETHILKSVNLTNFQFVSALTCIEQLASGSPRFDFRHVQAYFSLSPRSDRL